MSGRTFGDADTVEKQSGNKQDTGHRTEDNKTQNTQHSGFNWPPIVVVSKCFCLTTQLHSTPLRAQIIVITNDTIQSQKKPQNSEGKGEDRSNLGESARQTDRQREREQALLPWLLPIKKMPILLPKMKKT